MDFLIAASRTAFLIGLLMCMSTPASRARRTSSSSAEAVRARDRRARNSAIFFPSANRAGRFKPVHHGHLNVHEHDVVVSGLGLATAIAPFSASSDALTGVLEVRVYQQTIVVRVVGQEDVQRHIRLRVRCGDWV